eukprot:COSAG01_NODE_8541_length_2748_cov_3.504719_2_plen_160_part_00
MDSEQEVEAFDAAQHFNTAPELVERHYNRPTLEQLAEREYAAPTQRELNKLEKAKARQYQQLAERQSREEKLSGWMVDMGMQTQLMGACVRACLVTRLLRISGRALIHTFSILHTRCLLLRSDGCAAGRRQGQEAEGEEWEAGPHARVQVGDGSLQITK